jgi:hypothetical protein
MSDTSGVSRNVIKEIIGECIRDQLPHMSQWVRSQRKKLAEELRTPPDTLRNFSASEADPYSANILFALNQHPYELIVRTKRTEPSDDGQATLEPINGSRQTIRRRLLYFYLTDSLEGLPDWLNVNLHSTAARLRVPPSSLEHLVGEKPAFSPYHQPLRLTWAEYTIELIVRAKSR